MALMASATVAALAVCGVTATGASALVQFWTSGSDIAPGARSVGPYKYLFGVGYETFPVTGLPPDAVCMGAKTNADGSGGNAIPFTCLTIAAGGVARWTPGGQSNYGYPTIINRDTHVMFGSGLMNWGFP